MRRGIIQYGKAPNNLGVEYMGTYEKIMGALPKDYGEYNEVLLFRERNNCKKLHPTCMLIKDHISLMIDITRKLDANYQKKFSMGKKASEETTFQLFLNERNICYVVSAYQLALKGLIEPSHALMRTFFESCLTMHAIKHSDKYEKYYKKQFALLDQLDKLIVPPQRPTEEAMELSKQLKKLARDGTTISTLAAQLYEPDYRDQMKIFEAYLSINIHANIRGSAKNLFFDPNTQKGTLDSIRVLLAFFSVTIAEVFSSDLEKEDVERLVTIANVVSRQVGHMLPLPNKEGISPKLNQKKLFVDNEGEG